ncbi:DNA-directed RNA polymerase II subunit RPB4 [Rhodotorula toruloides]|uniref:DNA-directed RNA polymerase II subunit RPB4 n=1 Tax=Rhodotorula toruloides TaxID=5286 RepID=A0A511KFQ3_RHOTO|nr:DNA-directed RNA polymerase II subunit RPB4 [Rhodotorula toruloides]
MLSISEVKLVLESLDNPPDNAVYNKTKEYVDTFARFYDHETAFNVRSGFPNPPFQFFEQVQLVNLCPMEAEEAKALIPSIQVEDDQLQQYLDDMTRARKAQQPPA